MKIKNTGNPVMINTKKVAYATFFPQYKKIVIMFSCIESNYSTVIVEGTEKDFLVLMGKESREVGLPSEETISEAKSESEEANNRAKELEEKLKEARKEKETLEKTVASKDRELHISSGKFSTKKK